MRHKLLTMIALAAGSMLLLHLVPAQAQEMMIKPGPEHQALEPLIGTWTAKLKLWAEPGQPPFESESTMTRKWIMNGLFMQEDFEGKLMGTDFKGMGIFGYDANKKKYVGTWIDCMTTSISLMEGSLDAKTKTFSMTGDDVDPTNGKPMKARNTLKVMSNDHHLQEMFRSPTGGKETKMLEIQYHRIKK